MERAVVSEQDLQLVQQQLGRVPRGVAGIAHRCDCGAPDVVLTEPRLPDGTPFPTTFYLTCPRLTGAISTLESSGLMAQMSKRLRQDPELAAAYARAHTDYLQRRAELGEVPHIAGTSAGGMPTRVKCLHVLVGHSLAAGPGINPLGDEALAALPPLSGTPCKLACLVPQSGPPGAQVRTAETLLAAGPMPEVEQVPGVERVPAAGRVPTMEIPPAAEQT